MGVIFGVLILAGAIWLAWALSTSVNPNGPRQPIDLKRKAFEDHAKIEWIYKKTVNEMKEVAKQ